MLDSGEFSEKLNRGALVFTSTPVWIFKYDPTVYAWILQDADARTLNRPMQFDPTMYLRDHNGNIVGFYEYDRDAYIVLIHSRYVVSIDIDAVIRATNERTSSSLG
jgi:hypothetical protein